MITELLDVTDQYVNKMQIAGNIVPSNIQEGNKVVTFSHIMNFFGKVLVTNRKKWHFLSEKLITKLSGDCRDCDKDYTSVDKPDSTEDTTADGNLEKFTENNNDKSVVNNQESGSSSPQSGSASPHTSVNSF